MALLDYRLLYKVDYYIYKEFLLIIPAFFDEMVISQYLVKEFLVFLSPF